MNSALPDSVVYGDVLMKGFGKNALTRGEYRSVAQYLVRMGYCSVDRDINIDVNSETKKYMKKLSKGELYAVRRVRAKRGAERRNWACGRSARAPSRTASSQRPGLPCTAPSTGGSSIPRMFSRVVERSRIRVSVVCCNESRYLCALYRETK